MRIALLLAPVMAVVALTGCGHKKAARVPPPPPPPAPRASTSPRPSTPAPAPPPAVKAGEAETGIASWYGHPYHGRQAADGEIYDMETLVAAHRTLPFHTWVRVVNLRNNKTVDVRIIDRGPFIEGRIIDLSHAAAEKIDLVRAGIGPVRIEVISAPSAPSAPPPTITARAPTPVRIPPSAPPVPAPQRIPPPAPVPAPTPTPSSPGTFAVQVGIYLDRSAAERVREEMEARYGTARIVRRDGLHDMWRVLVGAESTENDANSISERIRQYSGERNTFVVRLDSY